MLEDYYFLDSRVVLVPTEHLTTRGVDSGFAATLRERAGWTTGRVDLLTSAFAAYWNRAALLAERVRHLRPPRRRSIAVIRDPAQVRPYVALLNTSTWTVYESDLDPERSHPELVTYALLHGDRLVEAPEIGRVAIDLAPYWFERSPQELRAFADAARVSTSPDGAVFREVGEALTWLRELRHETLRPPRLGAHRPVPGTGLLVPRRLEAQPEALVERCREGARAAIAQFRAGRSSAAKPAAERLVEWLSATAPPVLITASGTGRTPLWDPEVPDRVDGLAAALDAGMGDALDDIRSDLQVIAAHSRRFHGAVADPEALPRPDADAAQRGYTFLHRDRGLLAYDLDEPGLERLRTPALPYSRAMLGARAWHEWAHLAVDAGWVPRTLDDEGWRDLEDHFADLLETAVREAPRSVRAGTAADLEALPGAGSAGERLARLFATRLPDYRANLLACRFMSSAERETYVRQNVRALRMEYAPAARWRLLVRFLYEAQYLSFSAIEDPRSYFLDTTWFRDDFLDSEIVRDGAFDALEAAAGALCEAHAVDETRFLQDALPAASWRRR